MTSVVHISHDERLITVEQWGELGKDERRELVDGRLVEGEMVGAVHEIIVAWLVALLHGWLRPRGGLVFASGVGYAVSEHRGCIPDVSVFSPGHGALPPKGVIRRPPDIAVEVLSEEPRDHRRDRIEKMAEYAAFGIRWYWLIDPDKQTLEIYELGADGHYVRRLGASEGCFEQVPGCEGLVLDLGALWAEVARLE